MSNSGAWTGEHSEQLQEMYEAIVTSEKLNGRKITLEDQINIRNEIADAYDEIINCFQRENADQSMITYAVNLMKSTVSNTNDLRNITQLAATISESTIGALYLVNELQQREINKNLQEIGNLEDVESRTDTENIIQKIDFSMDSSYVAALCSDENEKAYKELFAKAAAGDEEAMMAVDLIEKAIHYMCAKPKGKGCDLGALALVDKLVTTGESVSIKTANQMIEAFGLERFDIYDQDENGQKVINIDKVKDALKKESERIHMKTDLELIKTVGVKNERKRVCEDGFSEDKKYSSMAEMIAGIQRKYETIKFIKTANVLYESQNSYTGSDGFVNTISKENFENFMQNNIELSKDALTFGVNFFNEYRASITKSNEFRGMLETVAALRKDVIDTQKRDSSDKNVPGDEKKDIQIGNYTFPNNPGYNMRKQDDDWEVGD